MLGGILVKVAFALCLTSSLSYFLHHLRGIPAALTLGRWTYRFAALSVIGTAATLLTLILTHQFQYAYVWSYSSRALSTPLLISTFYAGQEGSFALWTLFTTLIGLFLIQHSRKMGYESAVMSVYGFITLALVVMLIAKSPFTYVWENWAGEVKDGFMPADGRGLNPLLQNYWMVIHPQVLFSGFAAMSVPYSYAVAALMKRDYASWIKPATPWLAFAGLVLGLGIMMGGFWAYETLGWGGYWGWDPVENSSLVPWLVCIAALHTTLSQRKTGGFMRTNLVLAMMTFMMVLYSTFLTRSGVLGDTSVHSFVDPGMWVYWLLICLIVVFLGIGVTMLVLRWKEIPWPKGHRHSSASQFFDYVTSREFSLFLGASALFLLAILISFGTSSPVITDILQGKKSAIDIAFYATWSIPFGIAIGLLTGFAQLLWWTKSDRRSVLRSLAIPAGLALLSTFVVGFLVLPSFGIGTILFAAFFALYSNIQVGVRVFRGNPKFMGGAVAHIGLAIMILGFVASSAYDRKETISLARGDTVQALGYRLTYRGYKPVDNERYAFHVTVERGGNAFTIAPVMYYSTYTDGLMRNPDILNRLTHDFYLAPLSLEEPSADSASALSAVFHIGESKSVAGLQLTFVGFELPETHMASAMGDQDLTIGARFSVASQGAAATQIVPAKRVQSGKVSDAPARFADRYEVQIVKLTPDTENRKNSTVEISVADMLQQSGGSRGPDILVAEASVKPFINLVWAGLIILLVGFGVTIVRRTQEASQRQLLQEESA